MVVGLLVVALGWPFARLVAHLAEAPGAFSVLLEPTTLLAAYHTIALALGVAAMAFISGFPLGLMLGRIALPWPKLWRALVLVPFAVPPWVMAMAWLSLLNPATGRLVPLFHALGLAPPDVYGPMGMVLVLGFEAVPIVVLATADAAARVDPSLEEAARVGGVGPLRALWVATAPLALPAAAMATAAAASGAVAAWSVPYLLSTGSTRPWPVLATRLVGLLDADPVSGLAAAAVLALLLCGLGALPVIVARVLVPDRGRVSVGGRGARRRFAQVGAARWPLTGLVAAWCCVTAVMPLVALVATSISGGGWGRALSRPDVWDAVARSLVLATLAGITAAGVAAVLVWAARRARWRGSGAALTLARLPWAVPGTALALMFLLGASQEIALVLLDRVHFILALGNTATLLLFAYVLRFLALPVGAVDAAFGAVDGSLEEAAALSGAGPARRFRAIGLPLVRRDVWRGGLLVGVAALSEVTMSVLLCGPDSRVVGTVVFDLLTYGDPSAAAALGVGLAAVGLVGAAAVDSAT